MNITQKAAWHLAHRIRESFHESGGLFAGPVEVEEIYTGGFERNKHADKKRHVGAGRLARPQ